MEDAPAAAAALKLGHPDSRVALKLSALEWLDEQIGRCNAQVAQIEQHIAEHSHSERQQQKARGASPAIPPADRGDAVTVEALEEALQRLGTHELMAVQQHVLSLQQQVVARQQLDYQERQKELSRRAAHVEDAPSPTPTPLAPADSDERRKPQLSRRLSARSEQVVLELELVKTQLAKLRALASEASLLLDSMEAGRLPLQPSVRNTLAQLYGDCNRILSIGGRLLSVAANEDALSIRAHDDFNTSDIVSARGMARSTRKTLVDEAEALAAALGSQIERYDLL